ncbi:MAG: phytanoyl-CoA dioxygenase family protein [Pseudomonadota bacterium]
MVLPSPSQALSSVVDAVVTNPLLFGLAFHTLTMNPDKFELLAKPDRYPSRFGGLWTDRDDFEALLAQKSLAESEAKTLRQWRDDGYVIFENAIDPGLIDAFNEEMRRIETEGDRNLMMTGTGFEQGAPLDLSMLRAHQSTRIVDVYHRVAAARDLLFSPPVSSFLQTVFETDPLLTQSLSFVYGSEQAIHQDTNFVIMNAPMKLAAVWIALEDVEEDAGALIYHPGSHRWGDHLFAGRYKHWHRRRDGMAGYHAWEEWMRAKIAEHHSEPQMFRAKKGDILFWHAGLAHGGGPIGAHNPTRRSLVAHYCPSNRRPYYHVYAPRTRRIYREGERRWSTRHYIGR